jgi:hypothetical protein
MQSTDPTVEEDFRTAYEWKLAQSLRSGLDSILKHIFVLPIRGAGSQLAGLGDVLLGLLIARCILWGLASDTDIPLELSEEAKHLRSQVDRNLLTVMSGSEYVAHLRQAITDRKPEFLNLLHATGLSSADVVANLTRLSQYDFALGNGADFHTAAYSDYHAVFTLQYGSLSAALDLLFKHIPGSTTSVESAFSMVTCTKHMHHSPEALDLLVRLQNNNMAPVREAIRMEDAKKRETHDVHSRPVYCKLNTCLYAEGLQQSLKSDLQLGRAYLEAHEIALPKRSDIRGEKKREKGFQSIEQGLR